MKDVSRYSDLSLNQMHPSHVDAFQNMHHLALAAAHVSGGWRVTLI